MTADAPDGIGGGQRANLDYLAIGHVVIDRLDAHRVAMGGTATYAALTARNMGARVGIHTSASYEPGFIDVLGGVLSARIPAEYTTCFVNDYSTGTRRQTIESIAEKLTYDQILPEWRNASVVHLAPVCDELDPAMIGRFPRSLVGVTPQGWMREWDQSGAVRASEWTDADRVLSRVQAVILSEDDVPDRSLIDEWGARARLLVVTRGDRGCDVYRKGQPVLHSAAFKPAAEVDPTGAGDVFAAAFLCHLHHSRGDVETAAHWANCVASFVVEKRGPGSVPKRLDVEKRWHDGVRVGVTVGAS